MRKNYKLILKEDLELFEIAVDYARFFDDAVMDYWKGNVDVLRRSVWRNTVNEAKNTFFMEAEASSDKFFDKEFFTPLKNADIFKLFKAAEHAVYVFKMRGTFSKASKKAIEEIRKVSCPMHREVVEEIVKKAIEKQQNVKNEGCEVEKKHEKESLLLQFFLIEIFSIVICIAFFLLHNIT
ncbi:hypothetical protein GPK78_08470 [Desulfovibrio desulfuricans]|nr:hypothetical protein [Desulfovibrio desulfuricans]